MVRGVQLTEDAESDLDEIWDYVADSNIDAADRIIAEVRSTCLKLATNPGIGHTREDLTELPVKFISVFSYLIVYDPETSPLQIVAVLHGARDVASLMRERLW